MRLKGQSAAALLRAAASLVFLAMITACAGGAANPDEPAVGAREMPREPDVTFYVVAFHWGWDVFSEAGQKLDGIRVPEGTVVELYGVNSQAEQAINRLPAPVAAAIRSRGYPETPSGIGIGENDLGTHGFMIEGYRVVEQLRPDAGEPVRVAFVADHPGTYRVQCTIYCGVGHQLHDRDALVVEAADAAPSPAIATPVAPDSTPSPAGDPAAGREFFTSNACNACHPGGEKLVGPSLFGVTQRLTESQLRSQIRDGGALMPPFGTDVVSDEALDNLIAFLRTLE